MKTKHCCQQSAFFKPMFHLSYENAQYHQTISEVKSQFRALASSTFPNIVKLLKQRESI